jgi:hypothetical protein
MGDEVLAGLPLLAGVAFAAEGERPLDLLAVDRLGRIGGVLLDDREKIAEQGALTGRELTRDRIRARRPVFADRLADSGVPATIRVTPVETLPEGLGLVFAGYVCALLRRNRVASWCLARQAT